jgi:hypothetical protein
MKKLPPHLPILLSVKNLSIGIVLLYTMMATQPTAFAEGSKDFVNYPGYRLFLDTRDVQQFKVYANAGEFINVGASRVGYRADLLLFLTRRVIPLLFSTAQIPSILTWPSLKIILRKRKARWVGSMAAMNRGLLRCQQARKGYGRLFLIIQAIILFRS